MLPAKHRLTESALFAEAVRSGQRAGGRTLVVHLMARDSNDPVLVGFVVSKAVGNAVVRNKVKRRLRAIMATQLGRFTPGSLLVVRALPASARMDFDTLSRETEKNLRRLVNGVAA